MGVTVRTESTYLCDKCGVATATTSIDGNFSPPLPEGWQVITVSGDTSAVYYIGPECQPLISPDAFKASGS